MDWTPYIIAGLTGTATALTWTVRMLWTIDRRVVRMEEHLNLNQRSTGF